MLASLYDQDRRVHARVKFIKFKLAGGQLFQLSRIIPAAGCYSSSYYYYYYILHGIIIILTF